MDYSNIQYGQIVPSSTIPGYVVLSYIVSVIGCITALELLHRRHSYTGRYNWFLLAGAATAMGGVAIWSMHFIGMSAIVMADNSEGLQIRYSPAYTIGSLLVAIGVVALAFFIFSASGTVTPIQVAFGGIFCGAAVCGMHYLGQAGMVNYHNIWDWRFILGSAIIAIVAATIALGIFFWQKSVWTNALWKRVLCGFGLAAAVSLMHWVAVIGSTYAWQGGPASTSGWSKTDAVWVCGALAIFCCCILLSFGVLWRYVQMLYAKKAQQVTVALAYWDSEGKIMLNSSGLLPSSKIIRSYIQQSHKDHFDEDHPTFSWLFQVSRNWSSVTDLIPYMRQHVRLENPDGHSPSVDETINGRQSDSSLTFKELFCLAAHDLAFALDFSLREAGVLYDKVLDTGSLTPHPKPFTAKMSTLKSGSSNQDAEQLPYRPMTLGRGQMLFLVRKVNKQDVLRLQSQGFSFAPVNNVLGDLAHSMQISSAELKPYLDDLSVYQDMPKGMTAGVHIASFVLKPRIGGFEVLVRKDLRNLLPSVRLSTGKLDRWHTAFLAAYDDWDVHSLLNHWKLERNLNKFPPDQKEFVVELCNAMRQLQSRIGDKLFQHGRLIARPFQGPCRSSSRDKDTEKVSHQSATVIAFRFMADIHYIHPAVDQDTFVPTRIFLAQQHCYAGSPDHHVFASHVREEFAFLYEAADLYSPEQGQGSTFKFDQKVPSRKPSFLRKSTKTKTRNCIAASPQPLSSKNSDVTLASTAAGSPKLSNAGQKQNHDRKNSNYNHNAKSPLMPNAAEPPSGGIHVSSQIEVKISEASPSSRASSPTMEKVITGNGKGEGIEMNEIGGLPCGVRTEIGTGRIIERESMMDMLMGLTLGKASSPEQRQAAGLGLSQGVEEGTGGWTWGRGSAL